MTEKGNGEEREWKKNEKERRQRKKEEANLVWGAKIFHWGNQKSNRLKDDVVWVSIFFFPSWFSLFLFYFFSLIFNILSFSFCFWFRSHECVLFSLWQGESVLKEGKSMKALNTLATILTSTRFSIQFSPSLFLLPLPLFLSIFLFFFFPPLFEKVFRFVKFKSWKEWRIPESWFKRGGRNWSANCWMSKNGGHKFHFFYFTFFYFEIFLFLTFRKNKISAYFQFFLLSTFLPSSTIDRNLILKVSFVFCISCSRTVTENCYLFFTLWFLRKSTFSFFCFLYPSFLNFPLSLTHTSQLTQILEFYFVWRKSNSKGWWRKWLRMKVVKVNLHSLLLSNTLLWNGRNDYRNFLSKIFLHSLFILSLSLFLSSFLYSFSLKSFSLPITMKPIQKYRL